MTPKELDMREIDKLVEKVLPMPDEISLPMKLGREIVFSVRSKLRDALTSGVLCEPLSVEEIEKIIKDNYDDFLSYYYNSPCSGCKEGHASMWKTIVESPQWKEWQKVGQYDFAECNESGIIS